MSHVLVSATDTCDYVQSLIVSQIIAGVYISVYVLFLVFVYLSVPHRLLLMTCHSILRVFTIATIGYSLRHCSLCLD